MNSLSRDEGRALLAGQTKKPRKYRNKRVQLDDIWFDSIKERDRYCALKLLVRSGHVSDLKLQPRYPLHGQSGLKVGEYRADFEYIWTATGEAITEDVKSVVTAKTRAFQHKKRHFERDYKRKLTVTI